LARKILLADDSVTAQNMGRKILADAGYEVITVNNGSAALKKIAEAKPDLIVLDVYMPGYSGLEVCQRLKEAQETSRIPVMLTVGKLEPFKPEEARRVRAEGFIVKPFEASELLAALAKLEDKIVPRAEPSKPGRFARANAAIDEGRYDKTVAVDEDSGWKNRIAFPSKKKKAAENEDGDDPAIYNAVNKDLRTTIEHKPAQVLHSQAEEERVDLGALAPEGLPKDVTPEEIAALAAAAAQVKGKLAEPAAEPSSESGPAKSPEGQATELKVVQLQNIEAKAEEKPLTKEEVPVEAPKEAAPEVATFAEQKSGAHVEELAERISDIPTVAATPEPSPADMMAAIAALEIGSGNSTAAAGSQPPADMPVTMAVAAGAEYLSAPSRWTAVAVSLSADEASTSLENEMQKAHAAFAAAEVAHAAPATSIAETPVAADQPAPTETISPVEAVTPELVGPVQTHSEPEPQDAGTHLPSVSSTATGTAGAISSAVKVFETVAASFFKSQPTPTEPEPAPVQTAEPVVAEAVSALAGEAKHEEPALAQPTVAEPEKAEQSKAEEIKQDSLEASKEERTTAPIEAQKKEDQIEEQKYEHREERQSEESHGEEPAPAAPAAVEAAPEASPVIEAQNGDRHESAAPIAEQTASQAASSQISSEVPPPAPGAEHAAKGTEGMGTKESEIAETTAAAWASWRRIRESSDSKHTPAQSGNAQEGHEVDSASRDEAAMAVAAGAEKAPEEASTAPEESGEIANIVDSVLAEMRPKIVAEISKKIGKKK
jgi:two-component system chemotaxis response regulator CheY